MMKQACGVRHLEKMTLIVMLAIIVLSAVVEAKGDMGRKKGSGRRSAGTTLQSSADVTLGVVTVAGIAMLWLSG
jgi:hypothetical protein